MKHIVALLITLCLLSIETKAQQTLSFPDVDAIGYSANSASIELYTAIGHNQYRTRSLRTNKKYVDLEGDSDMKLVYWDCTEEDNHVTKEQILSDKKTFLNVNDLPSTSLNDYIGKIFYIDEKGTWRREHEKTSLILKFLNQGTASIQEVYYGIEDDPYNRRAASTTLPESMKTWRVSRADFYTPYGVKTLIIYLFQATTKIFLLRIHQTVPLSILQRLQRNTPTQSHMISPNTLSNATMV